ncbi:MAG: riboflavin synthase [Synergistaceae bacterium]|nr:riboflavin synthase [Synergistaceae bacterium]
MFTGLVECVGAVKSITVESADVRRIVIHAPAIARAMARGDSVAVSGVCLTVVESGRDVFQAQIMEETLRTTKLGALSSDSRVNLERPALIGGRLDGHIVLGHVDGVGRMTKIENYGRTSMLRVSVPREISWGIAARGSVSLDGVSLTVVDASDEEFSVGLIPTTLQNTALGSLSPGDPVNVEIDVIARYVAKLASSGMFPLLSGAAGVSGNLKKTEGDRLTWDKLEEYGWTQEG